MKTRPWWFYKQSAVIPYRSVEGRAEVLLITSRKRGLWIIPKGVVDLGKTAPEAAANEAYEEAGVRGSVSTEPSGEYSYEKWGGTCRVEVFLMKVESMLDEWPEKEMRRREWMSIENAADAVKEEELKRILLSVRDGLGDGELI